MKLKKVIKNACIVLLFATLFSSAAAKESKHDITPDVQSVSKEDVYTINYDNVAIIEYLGFVSKICNVNFIYNDSDLKFNVTVVSKEPITQEHVMSTLIQILRINGFYIVEENSNLIISKSNNVKEVATLANKDLNNETAPIVTSVFTLKNTNIESISTIIRPMISTDAIIEAYPSNRQLIISDITPNIKKIAQLIDQLETSENPLIIEQYKVLSNHPITLISLLQQIISPLTEGSPFIVTLQDSTDTLFIVSTPKLANKALALLGTLDGMEHTGGQDLFLYKAKYVHSDDLKSSLDVIANHLEETKNSDKALIDTIKTLKILDTNSILFRGSEASIVKLQTILQALDTETSATLHAKQTETGYFLYKLVNVSGSTIEKDLAKLADQLRKKGVTKSDLLYVIDNDKWEEQTNSILLTGPDKGIEEAKGIIAKYDIPTSEKQSLETGYFLYKLQNASGETIEEDLEKLAAQLKEQGVKNDNLLDVIENAYWIKETNSILLTGNAKGIEEAKEIIAKYDIAKPFASDKMSYNNEFFMYTPKHLTAQDLEDSLKDIAKNLVDAKLADANILTTLNNIKYVSSTNSLVFTGNEATLNKIKELLTSIDVATSKQAIQHVGKTSFFIYKIQNASPKQLISSLKSVAADLDKFGGNDKDFIIALKTVKYVQDTNSLVFTGNNDSLEKIQNLVPKFDIAIDTKEEGPTTYYVYKPKYLAGPDIEKILFDFAEHLKVTGLENPYLYDAIESMNWSENTNSLVFTGTESSIEEIKVLLVTFDVPGKGDNGEKVVQSLSPLDDLGFLVYKLQYHKGDEIQEALKQIAQDLISPSADQETPPSKLIKSINSIQWIKMTNSLLCSGDSDTIERLKELIRNLDVPLKQVFIEMLVIETSFTNTLNFGLDWGGKFQYKNKAAGGTGNFQPADASGTSPTAGWQNTVNQISNTRTPVGTDVPLGSGFDLGIIGDILMHKGTSFISLSSLLQALQTDAESTVVMTPKIIAQDGKTSTIFFGSNIPYIGSQIQNQTNTNTTLITTNLEYRDIGMEVSITPVMGNSDTVTLTLELEKTHQIGQVNFGNVQGIQTSKTKMSTVVHIPNKSFLVLSGMVDSTKTRSKSGIPCLGGLPFIGYAFSQNNNSDVRDNVVIFLRPHIINSYKDMVNLTEMQEDFFREQTGTPALERDYDESIELLKTFEDE